MDQPRIHYTTTSDGASIAFFSLGEGIPVIFTPPIPWSHLQLEWEYPGYRAWFESNARNKRVIRYDNRGSGLSDRNVKNYAFDDFCLDIDAVADKLGLERFVLGGISVGGPVAIAYAASHPERVEKLVLWCSQARREDVANPAGEAMRALRDTDWTLFTETTAHAMVAGWGSSEEARRFAALMREAVDPSTSFAESTVDWDLNLDDDLSRIECPTLVLQRRESNFPDVSAARHIAALVPNAELVLLEGGALLPWIGDMDAVIRATDRFLGIETPDEKRAPVPAAARSEPAQAGGLVTILFTDIEGSTTLTQRIGDSAAQEVLRAHNEIVREALRGQGGRETKHTGDGIMASFPTATGAIQAAIDIQRAVAGQGGFRVRIGLNAGEPVIEDSDMFGTAVQLARRVCDAAQPGSILVTDVVRQLAAGKGYLFADTGEAPLRGFDEPVRLFEVRWQE
jgi:class 3 adenylate cyclase/pimeloyl-ACP methyl ester carboxylesterase